MVAETQCVLEQRADVGCATELAQQNLAARPLGCSPYYRVAHSFNRHPISNAQCLKEAVDATISI
eukprot:6487920-Amphidinium_carterae.1